MTINREYVWGAFIVASWVSLIVLAQVEPQRTVTFSVPTELRSLHSSDIVVEPTASAASPTGEVQ